MSALRVRQDTIAKNARNRFHFALAQKYAALHIEQAFQASSPKNFPGRALGSGLFLSVLSAA
jgi:hypothetical protein